ncbi:MAG: TraR/DksA family transcriptional regulator [Gammaproteobacteria bacterium]|nr:TraR/DksA family transcriptional regulator [Gammaproteobacteria bacterium]
MLSKQDIDGFRDQLRGLAERLESVAESGAEAARPVELDQARTGRVSRMDALSSQAMSVETQRRRTAELGRIRVALKRIDDGDYGYCLNCGEVISTERLAVDPAAPLCIGCANRAESMERNR